MTESIEITVDLQLSPCGTKMEETATVQGFNGILADFVSYAIEQSDDLPSGDFSVGGRIASQSILRQDGIWSRMGRFFRKFYTKRHSGDPVGRSRMEVKEILTLSFNNSTTNTVAASEEGLSKLIIDRFADGNSTNQLRRQLLTSNDTNSFFSYPGPVKVVVIRQNRHAGIKLAPLLGSIGVVVLVLAFVIRFSPRRWRTAGKKTSECTSHSSLPPPELIDISTDLSSIGVLSPASVFHASREAKGRRTSEPAAMVQELPPIPEEPDYDLERGLPNKHYPEGPTRAQAYPPNHAEPQDLKVITVVVGAGYPEDLGFTIWPGPEALEIKEVLGDSRLPLRAGDMIVEVDGQNSSRWKPVDFEEYLVERRSNHKTLLIARPNRFPTCRQSGRDDDFDETYLDDETPSYITEGYKTDCEDMLSRFDEVMFDDPTYYE